MWKSEEGVWASRLEWVAKLAKCVADKRASARMKGKAQERQEAAKRKMLSSSLGSTRMNRIRNPSQDQEPASVAMLKSIFYIN